MRVSGKKRFQKDFEVGCQGFFSDSKVQRIKGSKGLISR